MSGTLSTTFGNEPVWNSIIEVTTGVKWPALVNSSQCAKGRRYIRASKLLTLQLTTRISDYSAALSVSPVRTGLVDLRDENLAVTDLARACRLHDRVKCHHREGCEAKGRAALDKPCLEEGNRGVLASGEAPDPTGAAEHR